MAVSSGVLDALVRSDHNDVAYERFTQRGDELTQQTGAVARW